MTNAIGRYRKFTLKWHKTIGLIIGLPMLLSVVTGLILQFPQLFEPERETTTAMTIDPLQPTHWMRGTNYGLHHSFDEGTTWQEAPLLWPPGSIRALIFSAHKPRLVYALGSDALLVSYDSGRIWEIVDMVLPAQPGWDKFVDLSIGQEDLLLVLTLSGWARSEDAGLTWTVQKTPQEEAGVSTLNFIHDLHTGYWLGASGYWIITITAAGVILLMCSGYLLVFKKKKRGNRSVE